ncbi:MAG: serine--tRNA ligase, partial [Deltaproteobacteria bacterium]|nr:serine--tRNA ligase [Deltaproteobacteria bacterium]
MPTDKQFERLEQRRKTLQKEFDQLRARQNEASREIARLKKEGKSADKLLGEMQKVAERIKTLKAEQQEVEAELNTSQLFRPNTPHASVPKGKSSEDNRVERVWGEKPKFVFQAKDHVALGEALGILNFERAAKIAGARFAVLTGAGASLERALINFMLDLHTKEHGYTEVLPPFMVNADALTGTGQLPKFEGDLFKTTDGRYLVPTAEVPLTNLYRREILKEEDLPISLTAYTPCFRSEAGSYGKDVRGL